MSKAAESANPGRSGESRWQPDECLGYRSHDLLGGFFGDDGIVVLAATLTSCAQHRGLAISDAASLAARTGRLLAAALAPAVDQLRRAINAAGGHLAPSTSATLARRAPPSVGTPGTPEPITCYSSRIVVLTSSVPGMNLPTAWPLAPW